jgi:hypothetical protein
MVARGHVKNGVVVLDGDVRFPEGQEVTVIAHRVEVARRHSVLDIQPVRVGAILRPVSAEDDLLGEMLEGKS